MVVWHLQYSLQVTQHCGPEYVLAYSINLHQSVAKLVASQVLFITSLVNGHGLK